MTKDSPVSSSGNAGGSPDHNYPNHKNFRVSGEDKNSLENRWKARNYGPGAPEENAYRYFNADSSYYYKNPDDSKYFNDGKGRAKFISPGSDKPTKLGG